MCRERNREPAWVAAVRLALLRGRVDVESVLAEANLGADHERTVEDVLRAMADRDLLERADGSDRYHPGPVLLESAPEPAARLNVSDGGVHRWGSHS
ncbi:hypothetical protein BRD00_05870 [Halobacteriales archaeon QS_8_69_26]|nr:MAG: hypothetical protein BRD00_05870 [Halobacteriales archaeon QS_8_69_26]